MVEVTPDEVQPNPWNPNVMDEQTFKKELRSIKEHGFIDPITVRENEDGFLEIVDGEHRWKAAKELKLKSIPAVNLGSIGDPQAKKLTVIFNELKGTADPGKLGELLASLSTSISVEDLAADLPMSAVEIDTLIQSTVPFDWDAAESKESKERGRKALDERKFMISTLRGSISSKLADSLVSEFERTAAALEDKTAEFVMRDWLRRLQETKPGVE
jgi:ParB/RepB/Spo0J family partition protein